MSTSLNLRDAGQIAATMLRERWHPENIAALDAALIHHGRALDELGVILRIAARLDPRAAAVYGSRSNERLVAKTLLQVLAAHPRAGSPADLAPSEILSDDAHGAGGWRHLNRVLVVAAHDWSQVTARIPPEVQRGVIADVAALADAIGSLQGDLADHLHAWGHREELGQQLRYWTPELQTRALAALHQAQLAPRKDAWSPPLLTMPRIVPVVRASEIPEAASALVLMLRHRQLRLDASSAMELIVVHAQTTTMIGTFLQRNGYESPGRALIQHGERLLEGAAAVSHRLWSRVEQPHEHPLAQAREVSHAVGRTLGSETAARAYPVVRIALDYSAVAPEITNALIGQISATTGRQAWKVLEGRHWQPAGSRHLTELVSALERGRDAIEQLGPGVGRPEATPGRPERSAHKILATAKAQLSIARKPIPPPAPPPSVRPGRAR